jgi:hypothetical protein
VSNISHGDDDPITETIPPPPVEAIRAGDAEGVLRDALDVLASALSRLEALSVGIARALDLTATRSEGR